MFRKCCVPKCDSQRQDVKLHRFPIKKVVRDQWLRFINCEKIAKMDNLVNKVFVCNKHFEKRFISTNNRLRLGAYPTLFTEMEITSGNPSSSSCTESVQNEIPTYSSDHSYSRKRRHCEHTYCTSSDGVRVPIPDFEQPSTSSQTPTWTFTSHSLDKNALYPNGQPVSRTLKNTAEFLSFMDDLFDSVNGAAIIDKKNKSKCLRRAVTSKSRHHSFWTDAIKKLSNIKFITKDKKYKSVPSLKNLVATLKSFRRVWRYLSQKKNIKIMRPHYFNSDPIENFFGQVRAYNYRCHDPSVYTFKTLLITRYIKFHSDSFNCEDDTGKELLSIQSLFNDDNNAPNSESNTVEPTVTLQLTNNIENIQVQARLERISIHSRAYTVGWVTRKILQKIKCLKCKENLITSDEESNVHEWIKAREYLSIKKMKIKLFNRICRETFWNYNEYNK